MAAAHIHTSLWEHTGLISQPVIHVSIDFQVDVCVMLSCEESVCACDMMDGVCRLLMEQSVNEVQISLDNGLTRSGLLRIQTLTPHCWVRPNNRFIQEPNSGRGKVPDVDSLFHSNSFICKLVVLRYQCQKACDITSGKD